MTDYITLKLVESALRALKVPRRINPKWIGVNYLIDKYGNRKQVEILRAEKPPIQIIRHAETCEVVFEVGTELEFTFISYDDHGRKCNAAAVDWATASERDNHYLLGYLDVTEEQVEACSCDY